MGLSVTPRHAAGMQAERILKRFGAAVRRERKRRGLSQEELAFSAGLDRTYLSGVERGRRNIGLINIHRIARALRVRPADLL